MASLRALAPSLTRITIAGAVGAALHIGQGDKNLVDATAVDFSRAVLNQTEIDGEVISCEGPKDNAPAFLNRERVGTCKGPKVEFVFDPVDGTTATSKGRKDAISALACAPAGCFQVLPDDGYYFKVATDIHSKGKISLDMSIEELVKTVAKAKGLSLENFTVIMLERERHNQILETLRKLGVRIILIPDGDIAGAVVTCMPDSGVDLLVGAGAGPEATIAATAVKCLGGTMLVKVWKDQKDDAGRMDRLREVGVDIEKTYNEEELAKGNELVFAASGITKGELLNGVRFTKGGATVSSLCMRLPSGTIETSKTTLKFKEHPVYKTVDLNGHASNSF
ncbi:MAG: class II fructose-bisphosphatase [Candidatus Bathyarchaeota archaeon]|nr:MAG: class II fructose-bisphosphatase [Candidatus Bathyarchaeum tardum]WNZ28578.1 MAG: class II fructose-bisphosphatase [Candidatus Bathyarchaeota archaeon]